MRFMAARCWVSECVHGDWRRVTGFLSESMGEQWCEDHAEWVMCFNSVP